MRGVKKSRNGCATCKNKRLKCDESKPSCGRCVRLGIKCPGYSQSLRWVTKYEVLEDGASNRSSPKRAESDTRQHQRPSSSPGPSQPGHASTGNNASLCSDVGTPLGMAQWDGQIDSMNSALPELDQLDAELLGFQVDFIAQDSSRISEIDSVSPKRTASPEFFQDSSFETLPPVPAVQTTLRAAQSPGRLRALPRLQRSLEDPSMTLVEYYFKEVAGLFSSYDSHMNPFRTTVSRLWTSSPVLYRTLQSMAAATLVDDFPQFGPIGLQKRSEAIAILEQQTCFDDKSLLAILMLGQTASWHNANDLGVSFFNLLRKQINAAAADGSGSALLTNRNNYQFFEEALVYWEMLLSYVADHGTLTPSTGRDLHSSANNILTQQVPHPWTGIARDTQFAVHEVGRLVRRERKRVRSQRFTSRRDIAEAQRAIEEAQELEQRLLGVLHPTEPEIVNPGDDDTPVWHLLAMAEVYRYTGLLQLYRVFPDLLQARICSEKWMNCTDGASAPSADSAYADLDPIGNADFDNESGHLSAAVQDRWLTRFALAAMSKLKTIPLESRTRCLQPFVLVAASSEMRLPAVSIPLAVETTSPSSSSSPGDNTVRLSAHAIEVSRTRKFILGRLTSFLHVLPPKPIHVCLGLVREVWRRMDAGEADVFWMDVMVEKGWETTMG